MKINLKIIILLFAIFIGGCSSIKISSKERNFRLNKIYDFYSSWKGTKYKYGGMNKHGVDCSGLMVLLYSHEFHKKIPRTTKTIAKFGKEVDLNELEVGDLILFKINWSTRHVGVYIGNKKFIHSSRRKGVTISTLDQFWINKFWQGRRVL